MPTDNNQDFIIFAIIGIFAAIILLFFVAKLAFFFNGFSKELKYLDCEIHRTQGSEREYWKKKKKKAWLSLIPFVRFK